MKTKTFLLKKTAVLAAFVLPALLSLATAMAQQTQGPRLPATIPNVNLTDLDKVAMSLPDYGRKHMMIFYVDPDAHRQNRDFQTDVEARQPELESPNIQAYAILNLKDTILPNALVRSIADRRTRGKPSVNLADDNRILSTAWGLGDCNGKFCVLFVTRDRQIVYFRAGDFTDRDVAEFYATVKRYM
ncbi:MAG: hypothetical protein LBV18_01930 [Alistipes sp.]|jgi:hypothetical protein|nr:hypothetical protein [Alistipes sp.]